MRNLNWALIACSLVGAILMIALPILEAGDPIKLFDIPGGHGAVILICMLAGGALAAVNLAVGPARWTAIVALVGYAIVGMKLSGGDEGPVKIAAGGTAGMMLAFVGMLISLVLAIKPGKQRA
jgi:hypothetical protein